MSSHDNFFFDGIASALLASGSWRARCNKHGDTPRPSRSHRKDTGSLSTCTFFNQCNRYIPVTTLDYSAGFILITLRDCSKCILKCFDNFELDWTVSGDCDHSSETYSSVSKCLM